MRALVASVAIAALCVAIGNQSVAARSASLFVASTTFRDGALVPERMVLNAMSCHGQNVSPELHWGAGPKGTKTYALTAWDPDAPASGGWWHWVLYDIPASTHRIAEGGAAGSSGTTSSNSNGYGGPCPPPGAVHHYRFTVYALNVPHVGGTAQTTGPQLLAKMKGHILAQGVVVGLYKR